MNIKVQANRMLIAIDAFFKGIRKGKIADTKVVLIVFQQILGDSIIIQNSLPEYLKVFPPTEGYRVKFLVRPAVYKFMKETMELPKEIEFETVDFKKFLEDFGYYREIVNKYKGTASIVIVPGSSLSSEIFASANNAARKIGMIRTIEVKKPLIMAVFARIAYSERVRPEKTDMFLIRHRKLLYYLGDKDYKASLPVLKKQKRIIADTHYAVMCPGSSLKLKCWPIERFAETIDYIIEKYKMPVYLCGGTDEKEFEKQLLDIVKNGDLIHSRIGETSFTEWASIIQYADLVIGNDSATMHLAFASRTKGVCIAGAMDKLQYFPYNADVKESLKNVPITLYKDMPCEWCKLIQYDAGYGNEDCQRRIKNNQCTCCIDLITVDEVKKAIDIQMKEAK